MGKHAYECTCPDCSEKRCEILIDRLTELHAKYEQLQGECTQLKRDRGKLRMQVELWCAHHEPLISELTGMRIKRNELRAKCDELASDKLKLQQARDARPHEVPNLKGELTVMRMHRDELLATCDGLRATNQRAANKVCELQAQVYDIKQILARPGGQCIGG